MWSVGAGTMHAARARPMHVEGDRRCTATGRNEPRPLGPMHAHRPQWSPSNVGRNRYKKGPPSVHQLITLPPFLLTSASLLPAIMQPRRPRWTPAQRRPTRSLSVPPVEPLEFIVAPVAAQGATEGTTTVVPAVTPPAPDPAVGPPESEAPVEAEKPPGETPAEVVVPAVASTEDGPPAAAIVDAAPEGPVGQVPLAVIAPAVPSTEVGPPEVVLTEAAPAETEGPTVGAQIEAAQAVEKVSTGALEPTVPSAEVGPPAEAAAAVELTSPN